MKHRQWLRIISGIFAAIFGVSTVGVYFAWTAGLLGPIGDRASDPTLRFYFLYIITLILVGQALTGLPVWKLSVAWNGLKGWQRGLIGTAIVVIAIFAHLIFVHALEQRGLIDQKVIP